MQNKTIKVIYFFGICWVMPILLVIYALTFLDLGFSISSKVIGIYKLYFWSGLIVLIIDLWKSDISKDKKKLWTVLALFAIFCLPVYWYKYLLKGTQIREPLVSSDQLH